MLHVNLIVLVSQMFDVSFDSYIACNGYLPTHSPIHIHAHTHIRTQWGSYLCTRTSEAPATFKKKSLMIGNNESCES